jgi:hypothetical protein
MTVGNFNNDTKLDLTVVNNGENSVSVLLGNGDGSFQNQTKYLVGDHPTSVAIGDFNNDNKLDLAVTNYVYNYIGVLLGNGDGTFQNPLTYAVDNAPSSVAAGAFKDPRKLDMVVVNPLPPPPLGNWSDQTGLAHR